MKGWVGLVVWPAADGLPTLVVTHQLQVERRTDKVRRPETDVLQLCHATNWFHSRGRSINKPVFSFLLQLQTWHCPHLLVCTMLHQLCCSRLVSVPSGLTAAGEWDRRTPYRYVIIIIIIAMTVFMVLSSWPKSLREFTRFIWWM